VMWTGTWRMPRISSPTELYIADDHNGDVDGDMENASHLVSSRAMAAVQRRPKLLFRLREPTTRPPPCFILDHVGEQQ
jgi:hypothetical protein